MQSFNKYAAVILDAALDKPLDYGIPDLLLPHIKKGVRIEVPVRGKIFPGYVIDIKDSPSFFPVKPLSNILSSEEVITPELFELGLWMSKYYCTPFRQVLKILVPGSIRKNIKEKEQLFVMRNKTKEELQELCINLRNKSSAQADVLEAMLNVKKGIFLTELLEKTNGSRSPVDSLVKKGYLLLDIVRIDRSPLINEEYFLTKPKPLNPEQREALDKIIDSLGQTKFKTHLLHGVTGSGKTEVYLQAIQKALELEKGTIMLVPEIALTTQTIERFRSRFEGTIAILHHRLSDGERADEWRRIRRKEARIVIGARSAIFSPVPDLGLIIIDEEHEQSYKQNEEMPCYNARDLAVMRGKMTNATVLLGSATPSLESYHNAKSGKYTLSILKSRPDTAIMPKVSIVDMNFEYEKAKGFTNFSDPLIDGIKKRVEAGEQTILFLNRRGYHTTLFCQKCQDPIKCNHCDVSLTLHMDEKSLTCHLCGFKSSPPPKACPKCHQIDPMKYKGVGTELIEKSLLALFPNIRTLRMDADTTRHKGSHQKLFRAFSTGKADVLIGTQMIAKGLHFPSVTLVGILNSDSGLNIPDFRASENTFQVITQVAGRAGRGSIPGEVIIQTCMPKNPSIQFAAEQNYEKFYEMEIESRRYFNYPPLNQIVKLNFSGENSSQVIKWAKNLKNSLTKKLSTHYEISEVIPAGYAKIKDKYKFHCLIKGPGVYLINHAIEQALKEISPISSVQLRIDVNPSSTFF